MPSIVSISGRQDHSYSRNQPRNTNTPYVITDENTQKLLAARIIVRTDNYPRGRNYMINPWLVNTGSMGSIWKLLEDLSVMIGKTPIPYDECLANAEITVPEEVAVPTPAASELDEIRHSLDSVMDLNTARNTPEPGIDRTSLSRRYGQTTDGDTRRLLSDIYNGRRCDNDFDIIDITRWQNENEDGVSFDNHTLYGCSCENCIRLRRQARESRR